MKAQDLRIGNWVVVVAKHPDETMYFNGQIHTIGKDILKVGDGLTWTVEDLHPIPLTEEILLKCGFEKCESKSIDKPDILTIQISNSETLDYEEYEFFIANLSWNRVFTFWQSPKHLHQLQNLYFALTGEELKINL